MQVGACCGGPRARSMVCDKAGQMVCGGPLGFVGCAGEGREKGANGGTRRKQHADMTHDLPSLCAGNYAARVIIQRAGCTFPEKPSFVWN